MEDVIRYRHNAIQVDSIMSFMNVKGGWNQNCRDVYFIRGLGCSRSLPEDVQIMDQRLRAAMQQGNLLYKRLGQLPSVLLAEQADFYVACYQEWIKCGQRMVHTKVSGSHARVAAVLGQACQKVLRMYEADRTGSSESMKKNFMVKLLHWFDVVMEGFLHSWDERRCIKIVAADVEKEQEYLFFYMLTLIGCDVLLLQTKADIKVRPEWLQLSGAFVIGEYQACQLPDSDFEQENVQKKPEEETVRIHLPQRNRSKQENVQKKPEEETVRIHLPQRNRSKQENVQKKQPEETVQIHLPQRNRSKQENVQKKQPEETVQIHLPQRSRSRNVGGARQSLEASDANRDSTQEKTFEELALLASSVVMIAIHDRKGAVIGTGSGIMVGRDGYILTNDHVAAGGSFYSVRIENDETSYQTDEVIKYHSIYDLALLRIERKLKPVPIYQGEKKLARGQKVVAIGSPLGLFNSVSDGIISGFRMIDGVDMIQFTAPISHGSSGGAVLNMNGEVIGISTAGFDQGQNINLAVGYECINLFIRGFV